MSDERFDRGMEVRRRVMGDDYVDRALANSDDFTRDLQRMITEYAWGNVWSRPGLSLRERSLIVVTMLAALNRPESCRESDLTARAA